MLGVVIPCFNEEDVLDDLIREFRQLRIKLEFDLIFVNDGSTDGTQEKLREFSRGLPWVRIINHEKNLGMAQSLKDGLAYALSEGYDYIAQMDSDLTHPPSLLERLLEEIGDADIVIASRYVEGGGMKNVPRWRILISTIGNRLFRLILRIKTLDSTSGYRMAKRGVFEVIKLESDSFGIQLESTVKTERMGFKVKEVPLVLVNREIGESKFRVKHFLGYIPLVFRLMFNI